MPLPVISVEQMREWEKATWATGQSEAEVIRRVGIQVARLALELTDPTGLILILAGKGHNGDDVRAAREHLADRRVDVLDVTDPARDLSKLDALLSVRPSLIIDGLFGIGLNRALNSDWIKLIQVINEAQCKVLSIDVPSGLDAATGKSQGAAVEAAVTLTVGAAKLGMLSATAWDSVGRLEVARDVGLSNYPLASELQWALREDFRDLPPRRGVAGHKGTYGHLEIIAGSLGYHGAAVLAARGAQKAQPGLISLSTLGEVYPIVGSHLQAVMVAPWHQGFTVSDNRSAILIGPGLAANNVPEELKQLARNLWRNFTGPLVVDASGLGWIPRDVERSAGLRVITPHPGEAARMLETDSKQIQSNRLQAVRDLSRRFAKTWVVLKGHQTLIGRHEGEVWVNSSGNPHLAQGGSGDVLSGYIAGLLAQPALQKDPQKTLAYAVWEHGATADSLQRSPASWVVEDLLKHLGESS